MYMFEHPIKISMISEELAFEDLWDVVIRFSNMTAVYTFVYFTDLTM